MTWKERRNCLMWELVSLAVAVAFGMGGMYLARHWAQ
jgi:hypothetical protein